MFSFYDPTITYKFPTGQDATPDLIEKDFPKSKTALYVIQESDGIIREMGLFSSYKEYYGITEEDNSKALDQMNQVYKSANPDINTLNDVQTQIDVQAGAIEELATMLSSQEGTK